MWRDLLLFSMTLRTRQSGGPIGATAMPKQLETTRLLSPRPENRSVLLNVCLPILILQFSLWVASATLTGSVPIYLRKHLGIDSVRATEINYALQTLSNLMPIVGGYIADQYLGRFPTIVVACALFTTGMVLCTVASHPSVASIELLLLGLFGGVAIAQGGTAPCLVVLGADQFNPDIPSQRLEKESFFNWFYWSINIGSFVSFAFLANLAVNGIGPYVPPNFGFFAAFGIGLLVFLGGATLFFLGRSRYHRVPPQGSVLTTFFAVLLHICSSSMRGRVVLTGGLAFFPGILLTTASYFVRKESSWHVALALAGAGCVLLGAVVLIVSCQHIDWVFVPSAGGDSFGDQDLQQVSQVLRLMPYMSVIVIFWATYSQMETNFMLQGCQMDLRVGDSGTMVSSATLTIIDSGVILLFIPLFDRFVYPALSCLDVRLTTLRKIGAGLVFSLAAMIYAAWIELQRKHAPIVQGVGSNCAGDEAPILPMSTITVWWQAPQYVLVGISEILTSITSYDLFYSEVPESTRSVCQSLNLLTTTLGYIVAGALNSIFSFWIPSDLNTGHLENIFLIMAALISVSLLAFLVVAQSFQYSTPQAEPSSLVTGFSPAVARLARRFLRRPRGEEPEELTVIAA